LLWIVIKAVKERVFLTFFQQNFIVKTVGKAFGEAGLPTPIGPSIAI